MNLDDLVEQNTPQLFTGTQKKKRPGSKLPINPPPPPPPEEPTVADAGDPDSSYAEQAEARKEARANHPLPEVGTRNHVTVQITGRMKQLLTGEITVADLDDDELMSGTFKDNSGRLVGTRAKVIPKVMHQEIARRILQRGQERIRSDYFDALDVVSDIMKDTTVEPKDRLKAATIIIERVAGKTPERVEMSVEVKKYEQVATSIIRELPEDDVIDAEIVGDDDEPDE